jgi:hypothetical protein
MLAEAAMPQQLALPVLEGQGSAMLTAHPASRQGWMGRFAGHLAALR